MAVFVMKNPLFEISGSTTITPYVQKVSVEVNAAEQDISVFSSSAGDFTQSMNGVKNWSMTAEVLQEPTYVDGTLYPLVGASDFNVRCAWSSTGVSAAFPQFAGHAILASYKPIDGGVGDLAKVSATFKGTGILYRNAVTSCCGD